MGLFDRKAKPVPQPATVQALRPVSRVVETKPPVPVPSSQRNTIDGVLGELVQHGQLSMERAIEIQTEAERTGRPEHELLLQSSSVPRAEVYAAIERLPPALRRSVGLVIDSVTDLPEWSLVLNDAGGVLGGSERDLSVVAIGIVEEMARAKQNGEKPRCFVLATAESAAGAGYKTLVSRVVKAGFVVRALLIIANQSIADVVWAQWDERRGVAVQTATGGRAASDMQKLFDKIGPEAYALNASDIHFIAKGGVGSVLFRIDGDVIRQPYDLTGEEIFRLAGAVYDTYSEKSSVKEGYSRTTQQDGSVDRTYDHIRLRFRYSGNAIEPNGYRVAMRVIPIGTHAKPRTLMEMGFAKSHSLLLDRAYSRSSGLILHAGTTGSGKSTTISNRLNLLCKARPTKVVLTVEEPVEYLIDGAHQTAVKRSEGEDGQNAFQRTLRTIMRQDPDILMVGEVRDLQTADMALQGVRSGHLLVSTLHAAAAPTCYDRLAGLGVPRLDMATMDLVAAFTFQALTQTLCPHCKRPAHEFIKSTDPDISGTMYRLQRVLNEGRVPGAATNGDLLEGIFFRNESGCDECKFRGINGRTVCAEVFQPTKDMLPLVSRGESVGIWEMWRSQINPTDPNDMTGRRAIEHAMWKMSPAGGGVVSPLEVESQFRSLDEPLF
ncbi:MAG: GspE/PulE family protein [Rhodanobacter sp.]